MKYEVPETDYHIIFYSFFIKVKIISNFFIYKDKDQRQNVEFADYNLIALA